MVILTRGSNEDHRKACVFLDTSINISVTDDSLYFYRIYASVFILCILVVVFIFLTYVPFGTHEFQMNYIQISQKSVHFHVKGNGKILVPNVRLVDRSDSTY